MKFIEPTWYPPTPIETSSPEWAAKCEAFLSELTELSRKHGVVIERAWGGELNLEPMAGSRSEGGYVWTFADGFGCWEKR